MSSDTLRPMTAYVLSAIVPVASPKEAEDICSVLAEELGKMGWDEGTQYWEPTRDDGPVVQGWLLLDAESLTEAANRLLSAFGLAWKKASGAELVLGMLRIEPDAS